MVVSMSVSVVVCVLGGVILLGLTFSSDSWLDDFLFWLVGVVLVLFSIACSM